MTHRYRILVAAVTFILAVYAVDSLLSPEVSHFIFLLIIVIILFAHKMQS